MPPEPSAPPEPPTPSVPTTLTICLTPDDADAIYRTILGHHVRELEVHKTRVFAERLRQFVVDRMNDTTGYAETFNHASEILSAEEVARFLREGESYRSIDPPGARTA